MIIQNDDNVSKELIELIKLNGLSVTDESAQSINALLQEKWIKTKAEEGTLRCEIGGRLPNEQEYKLLNQLGFLKEIPIDSSKEYSPPIFLGATMKAMARRFQFLKEQHIVSNSYATMIYLLAGKRPVNEKLEGKEAVPSIIEETDFELDSSWKSLSSDEWPKTETEIAQFLVHYGNIKANCATVDLETNGSALPSTYSTAVELFKSFRFPSQNCLVVSSQPFCQNQLLTVKRAAEEAGVDVNCDVCGPAAPDDLPLARILDCISKQLWEEVQSL